VTLKRRAEIGLVLLLLVIAGTLSYAAALTESFTSDEPSHLTAGASYLATGDYRLNPEHPPLVKLWAALPLRLVDHQPFSTDLHKWALGATGEVAIDWLERRNDGNRLLRAPRAMMVAIYLALCATIGWTARLLLGPEAGLLATALAALDPLLLAHGHYVTTDVPVTLFVTLSIVLCASLLRQPSLPKTLAAAASLSAAALSKYSWVLVVPALLLMTALSWLRRRRQGDDRPLPWLALGSLPALVALSIWAVYGFRFEPFRFTASQEASEFAKASKGRSDAPILYSPSTREEAWAGILRDKDGSSREDASARLIGAARRLRLLPEAYLYGFTYAVHHSESRRTYLRGQFSETGWRSYFPIAYLVKTPVPELLLLAAGLAALITKRARLAGDPLLAAGLFTFAAVYGSTAILTNLNIGLRHMIPVYPALFLAMAASVGWITTRAGKIAVFIGVAWLGSVAVFSFPKYLGYFNELAGGWRNGHRWLVDSNLEWEQDYFRVREYQRQHPEERLILLSMGDSPRPPGLTFENFVPRRTGDPWPPALSAGTYVISATWLVGTFQPFSRDVSWENPQLRRNYRELWRRFGGRTMPDASEGDNTVNGYILFDGLRRALLLQRLRHRPEDARIGTSYFVYRLTEDDLVLLTQPE
jgi:4-amino-4-deoxy-L-arabinose transferase-like glycosyltransferase